MDTLVQLLEELSRPYKTITSHPLHVIHSELYVIELLAECCSTHWAHVNSTPDSNKDEEDQHSDSGDSTSEEGTRRKPKIEQDAKGNGPLSQHGLDYAPEPLDDNLVSRMFDAIKIFTQPVPDNFVLPAATILDDTFKYAGSKIGPSDLTGTSSSPANGQPTISESSKLLVERLETTESATRRIVEYISCSNWPRVLEYLKNSLRGLRAAHLPSGNNPQMSSTAHDDRSALITIRLISYFWVNSRKLSIVIQELCGSFLHLRKAFQTAVAIVVPLLITRWLERNPEEFVELHTIHTRLDGGAETLFDMTNTMIDGGRRKALLFPFQISLLFLLPEVFEVASNMKDVKSSGIAKKAQFLEMLRKSLRNRNEPAIYCLTSLLRVSRHFTIDSDAAILSFALDVQDEVREAVFRKYASSMDATVIDSNLMTAAFVSLVHLNFESCVETLTSICLAQNSPQEFKIAAISACSHFARQPNANDYRLLFSQVSEFMRMQLKVRRLDS